MLDNNIHNVLSLAFIVLLWSPARCHTMTDAKQLLADKQQGYEKTFRPIVNQSAPIVLYAGMELVSIQEFDEVQETLTVTAVMLLNWEDEYHKWNPDDYGGLEELVIESDKVWTPNLVLTNNVDKLERIGDAWQVIRFTSDGIAFYYPGNVFSASCRVDVTFYPWDRHKCGFSFNVWSLSTSEIEFQSISDKVQTTFFSENGAWTFYDSSAELNYGNGSIDFTLHLERKPRFVLVNVICPIIFMAFLNLMIFAVPVESGERISYSITMLLAIAVFLTLVGDNLPKTSNPMSFFSYYLLVVLIISICITLATIFNVRLFYRDVEEYPVPECLASFVRCVKCKCRNRRYERKRNYSKQSQERNVRANRNRDVGGSEKYYRNNGANIDSYEAYVLTRKNMYHLMSDHGNCPSEYNSLKNTVDSERNVDRLRYEGNPKASKVSWKDVSETFDKLFFILSFLIISIATVVFFLYIFVNERN